MTVKYQIMGDTAALITLNRPKALNSFNKEMRFALADALSQANTDPSVKAIVITGEGRGFSAGADVTDVTGGRTVEDMLNAEYGAFLSIIQSCDVPVIAAINCAAA